MHTKVGGRFVCRFRGEIDWTLPPLGSSTLSPSFPGWGGRWCSCCDAAKATEQEVKANIDKTPSPSPSPTNRPSPLYRLVRNPQPRQILRREGGRRGRKGMGSGNTRGGTKWDRRGTYVLSLLGNITTLSSLSEEYQTNGFLKLGNSNNAISKRRSRLRRFDQIGERRRHVCENTGGVRNNSVRCVTTLSVSV